MVLERHLPRRLHFLIDRYQKQADRGEAAGRPWKEVMKRYIWRTVLYSIVLLAILIVSQSYLLPYLSEFAGRWSKLLCMLATLVVMAPFILALIMPVQTKTAAGARSRRRQCATHSNDYLPIHDSALLRGTRNHHSLLARAGMIAIAGVWLLALYSTSRASSGLSMNRIE